VADHGPVWVSARVMLRYRRYEHARSLSGRLHAAERARGFVRVVEKHATRDNDTLLHAQAKWLLNQNGKHGDDRAAFELLTALFRERDWPIPLKPVLRARWRTLRGRMRGVTQEKPPRRATRGRG
jgi:hypothetical protein